MPPENPIEQKLSSEPKREERWYLKWWTVIVLLATLGPFGLPFLWKSKDFNLFWKWFWTIVILGLTIVLSWSTWKLVKILIDQFRAAGLI